MAEIVIPSKKDRVTLKVMRYVQDIYFKLAKQNQVRISFTEIKNVEEVMYALIVNEFNVTVEKSTCAHVGCKGCVFDGGEPYCPHEQDNKHDEWCLEQFLIVDDN